MSGKLEVSLVSQLKSSEHVIRHNKVSPFRRFSPYKSLLPKHPPSNADQCENEIGLGFTVDRRKLNGETLANVPRYQRQIKDILGPQERHLDTETDSDETNQLKQADSSEIIILTRYCFNCKSKLHSFKSCPEPHSPTRINQNRTEFDLKNPMPQPFHSRFHIEIKRENMIDQLVPGKLSDELKEALGMKGSVNEDIPPWYTSMRMFGYPPGYWCYEGEDPLKEAKVRRRRLYYEDGENVKLQVYGVNERNGTSREGKCDNIGNKNVHNLLNATRGNVGEKHEKHEDEQALEDGEILEDDFDVNPVEHKGNSNTIDSKDSMPPSKKRVRLVEYPGLDWDDTTTVLETHNPYWTFF